MGSVAVPNEVPAIVAPDHSGTSGPAPKVKWTASWMSTAAPAVWAVERGEPVTDLRQNALTRPRRGDHARRPLEPVGNGRQPGLDLSQPRRHRYDHGGIRRSRPREV